mmetsp:Transcript_13822/g.17501  ORF Transcript_13822/g.17501 Transcript_13822/m.17501 type:complete len:161 (+) Transcript_13822:1313-1795(+)
MAFAMALLDKKMYLAQISIAACWKGIRTRRMLRSISRRRRAAIWTITNFVRRKMAIIKRKKAQQAASVIVQKYCRGYLVAQRFIRVRAQISINASLSTLKKQRDDFGSHLCNLLRFHWRVFLRVKKNKAEAEEKKKAAAKKGKKGAKKGTTATKNATATN